MDLQDQLQKRARAHPCALFAAHSGVPADEYRQRVSGDCDAAAKDVPDAGAIERAKAQADEAARALNELRERISALPLFETIMVKAEERDKREPAGLLFVIFSIMFYLGLLTPILIAANLLVMSDKLPLVGSSLSIAALFVTGTIGGSIALSVYRETLSQIEAIIRFDRRLAVSTIIALLVFIGTLSLSAFPINFGGSLAEGSMFGSGQIVGGFTVTASPFLVFLAMAALDICAAPLIHAKLSRHKAHSLKTIIRPNAVRDYLEHIRLPGAEAKAVSAADHASALETALRQHETNRDADVAARMDTHHWVRSIMDRGGQEAIERLLNDTKD